MPPQNKYCPKSKVKFRVILSKKACNMLNLNDEVRKI
jgi:hypothetical protein